MRYERTLFDDPHHHSLELLAARALAVGDAADAFKYVDRRCRISPLPGVHAYVMRAEALFRMGEKDAAIADLTRALLLVPEDIAANRRMMAWGPDQQRNEVARVLV